MSRRLVRLPTWMFSNTPLGQWDDSERLPISISDICDRVLPATMRVCAVLSCPVYGDLCEGKSQELSQKGERMGTMFRCSDAMVIYRIAQVN